MTMRFRVPASLFFAGMIALSTVPLFEGSAEACGGCFHEPQPNPENNTVVSDHRMIMAIDLQQSTLYDQIRYQGSPSAFAWVLPIRGEAKVGVSSDAVFASLDALTGVQVIPPPENCPPPNCRGSSGGGFGCSATASSDGLAAGEASNAPPPVEVLKQQTVGPYETVQLRSTDPQALQTWLAKNSFVIPADVQPIIGSYVTEGFDFLAVKLVPGKGIQAMVPIRVTTPGASPQLPLRMVAAGTGAVVGITLWTIGDGRWEPKNFPSFTITEQELVWDWGTSSSNFKALRAQNVTALGASAWEIESSVPLTLTQVQSNVSTSNMTGQIPYEAVKDGQGNVTATPSQAFSNDMAALFGGRSLARVTRMRADLPKAALATDLEIQASSTQSTLPVRRVVTQEKGEPQCTLYDGCDVIGQGTRTQANMSVGNSPASVGGGGCSTLRRKGGYYGGLAVFCAAGALFVARRARRRR